jgi:ribosome biogenesis GTPase / thiamine phosphate phosphatase
MLLEGRVIRSQSRSFDVETETGPVKAVVLKGLRSRYPDLVDPVAVGDSVTVRLGVGAEGTIEEVHPRRNRLSRPAVGQGKPLEQTIAANVGRAIIVQATSPSWKTATWDRYLVMVSAGDVPAALCLNKIDLAPGEAESKDFEVYRDLGIPVIATSARTGEGIEGLRDLLRAGPSVFIGPSGAGKSSLINALAPGSGLRTGALSRSTGKGRHTTTWVELLKFGDDVEVVDSPGLRVLGLWGIGAEDLADHFPEFRRSPAGCRFPRCSHVHEPDCAVRQALHDGLIAPFRYDSYVRRRFRHSSRRS